MNADIKLKVTKNTDNIETLAIVLLCLKMNLETKTNTYNMTSTKFTNGKYYLIFLKHI